MSRTVNYPHLTNDEPYAIRIGRTRYKVIHLASEHYHYGWSAEELMRQHPDLRPEEIFAALTYFYDHYDDLVQINYHPQRGWFECAPQRQGFFRGSLLDPVRR